MSEFTIEIMGYTWKVKIQEETDDRRLSECSGFTDWTERSIVVYDGRKIGNLKKPKEFMAHVLRHEIIHAMLFECGLGDDWMHPETGHDETMVDWVARQLPKLAKVTSEAEQVMLKMLEENDDGD